MNRPYIQTRETTAPRPSFKRLWQRSALLLISGLSACSTHDMSHSLSWSQLAPLPDARGVAASFTGVSGGALLVAGGANFPDKMPWDGGKKVWYDTVYALTATNALWQPVGKLPRPLAYGVSVTTADGIACIGGGDGERHYPDVLLLTFTNGQLKVHSLPSLPLPLASAAGARVGSTIYVAGGSDQPGEQSALSQCYALDLARRNPTWSEVEPCPGKPRILPVAAALRGSFYLVGGAALERTNGRVTRVYLRDAWRYHPGKGWQRLPDLPKPCVAGPTPAPSLNDSFLLLGGDDGSRVGFQPLDQHPGFPRTILAYDANAETWRDLGEVPVSRVAVPTAFWHDRFVIPSGEERPGVRSPQVWSLTVETYARRR
jgi:N-acetylneuraminate epimerase